MARLARLILAAGMAGAACAAARAEDRTEIEPPFYPEIILETDDSHAPDPQMPPYRQPMSKPRETNDTPAPGNHNEPDAIIP